MKKKKKKLAKKLAAKNQPKKKVGKTEKKKKKLAKNWLAILANFPTSVGRRDFQKGGGGKMSNYPRIQD